MTRSLLLVLILSVYPGSALLAIDLSKIDRPAIKLPKLRSGAAQYCLLVFGPDAAKRIWLAHDGEFLYVDRNGNGDLTEPGETVAADATRSKPAEGIFSFKAGDISDTAGEHKELNVGWINIDHMKELDPQINARLQREPKFRGCRISLDVAIPKHRGQGIEGRVGQSATVNDCHGLLEFSPAVDDAPVIHFGGPWQVTLSGNETWRPGRKHEVFLVVGTPGVGPGTMACVAYENVIPADLKPHLKVTYPSTTGVAPLQRTYELTRRCCGVNLYGDVAVPSEAPPGVATVIVSLESWPGTSVADTRHEAKILPVAAGLTVEPSSSRLVAKLEHEHSAGAITAIQFSPDGKRLIAGDYPGGLVHIWDLTDGKRLRSFDLGEGFRSSFVVTKDWKTIIAPTNTRGKFDRVQRDGRTLNRARYDGSIRVWDLESGNVLHTWQDAPPRSIRFIQPLPDKKQFFTHEETAGEFEARRPEALSLWDASTGEHKEIFHNNEFVAGVSPDGKQAAVSIPAPGNDRVFHEAIAFYDIASWQGVGKVSLKELQRCHTVIFLEGASTAAAIVYTNKKSDDFQNTSCELKVFKVPNGEEAWSLTSNDDENFSSVVQTPDHRSLVVTAFSQTKLNGRMLLVDLATHEVKILLDDPNLTPGAPTFHPGGTWMVFPVQQYPKSRAILRQRDLSATELQQPHFQVRDVASGTLLEDLVSPPAFPTSIVFSPDGNTLATSGTGAVLLWDFSDPPGKRAVATVGQPFDAAGILVGGQKLDWTAYQGKVVLVTYWATWCKPCVAEIPELREIHGDLHERGFEVLAVSLDDDHETLERFLKTHAVPWQVVCGATVDASGPQHPMAHKYGVGSIPKSFLLDRQGKIAAIDAHGAQFLKITEKLLGPKDEKRVRQ